MDATLAACRQGDDAGGCADVLIATVRLAHGIDDGKRTPTGRPMTEDTLFRILISMTKTPSPASLQ